MTLGAASLLVALLGARPDFADTVVLTDGTPVVGTVESDNLQDVAVRPRRGPRQRFSADRVQSVEYEDAPSEYEEAISLMAAGRHAEAAQRLEQAIGWVREKRQDPRRHPDRVAPRDWFEPYATYLLAECLRLANDVRGAIAQYDAILQNHPNFRLRPQTYEGLMRCYTGTSDDTRAQELLQRLQGEADRIGSAVVERARILYLDLLLAQNPERAIAELEPLVNSRDEQVCLEAIRKTLQAFRSLGRDPTSFCRRVMASSPHPRAKVVAAFSLGQRLLEDARASRTEEAWRRAVDALVEATVVQFPGKGAGLDAEHRAGLMALGAAYEGLAEGVSTESARNFYRVRAARTYRLLAALYPQAPEAPDAAARAAVLEAQQPTESEEDEP